MAWLRKDAQELGLSATQLGLEPAEALTAMTIGAKLLAHGFTDRDISEMQIDLLRKWDREQNETRYGTADIATYRRVIERSKRWTRRTTF